MLYRRVWRLKAACSSGSRYRNASSAAASWRSRTAARRVSTTVATAAPAEMTAPASDTNPAVSVTVTPLSVVWTIQRSRRVDALAREAQPAPCTAREPGERCLPWLSSAGAAARQVLASVRPTGEDHRVTTYRAVLRPGLCVCRHAGHRLHGARPHWPRCGAGAAAARAALVDLVGLCLAGKPG